MKGPAVATKTYVCVAPHAITPLDGVVAPGDTVTLDDKTAAPWVAAGQLVEAPAAPAKPTPAVPAATDTAKENLQ